MAISVLHTSSLCMHLLFPGIILYKETAALTCLPLPPAAPPTAYSPQLLLVSMKHDMLSLWPLKHATNHTPASPVA